MAKLKSGSFTTWLKSCLAKKNLAFSPLALNHLSENQESRLPIVNFDLKKALELSAVFVCYVLQIFTSKESQPNIEFVLSDDILSCYSLHKFSHKYALVIALLLSIFILCV